MNWIKKLLNKPTAKPALPATPVKVSNPPEDCAELRAQMLAAIGPELLDLTTRLGQALARQAQSPLAADPPEVWLAAICQADKSLAQTWLDSLPDEAWLGEVATWARSSEVRFAAAQRIASSTVLEQIAQASRDKDKRVHRHCADRLRQLQLTESLNQQATAIAGQLRALLETTPLPGAPLLALKKELSGLGEAGPAYQHCLELLDQVHARLQQEAEQQRRLQTLLTEATALASECAAATWPWGEQLAAWQGRLVQLQQARDTLPSWLAGQEAARNLDAALTQSAQQCTQLGADAERAQACERWLDDAASNALPAEASAQWQALAKPSHAELGASLQTRWQTLLASQPTPATVQVTEQPTPQPKRKLNLDAVRDSLDRLEAAIGQGHLLDAEAAAKQLKARLADHVLSGALESRLHSLLAQLDSLRGWARWGTGQAREQLIAAAEALLQGEHPVDELAAAIPALREEWKRLNSLSPASKAQWEAFDTSLEKAYQPVAEQRAAQAQQQAEARAAKEGFCTQWEAELAGIDWQQIDCKVVETWRGELIKQWRLAPPASYRDERALRSRFDAVIAEIDQHLDSARRAEVERRQQLIAEAEALSAQTDLGQAMTLAKTLQERWQQQVAPVRLKRGEEDKLWQRFRAACNAVFERRGAQRAEQEARLQQQNQARQQLLEDFATALAGAEADAQAIRQALSQFRSAWAAARHPKRDDRDKLETRARDLQQQAQQRLDALQLEKQRARYVVLAQKARLCEQLEMSALAAVDAAAATEAARLAWDALPRLPGQWENPLAQRFEQAGRASQAALEQGRIAREALLLDLEITLGLPSPEAYATARRERQLQRLRDGFGSRQAQSPDDLLVQCCAIAALQDAQADQRIEIIVKQVVAQTAAEPASQPSNPRQSKP